MLRVNKLKEFVLIKLLPHWRLVGVESNQGCFYERLDRSFVPIDLGYYRLRVQARQVFCFSELALIDRPSWSVDLATKGFKFICDHYWDVERGGWFFSLGEGGEFPSKTRELYSHAFVLLACASFYKLTKEKKVLGRAKQTIEFIYQHFYFDKHGFSTALDHNLENLGLAKQQNPHMHLLESCLMMYEVAEDKIYLETINLIVELLIKFLFDTRTNTLTEFFDSDWSIDQTKGNVIEPGHHFEWVWLIQRWLRLAQQKGLQTRVAELMEIKNKLLFWAVKFGVDQEAGGIFDGVLKTGQAIKTTKRIWPILEAIKALAFSLEDQDLKFDAKNLLDQMLELLNTKYLVHEKDSWHEVLNKDLTPAIDYMPGSTLYHMVMAVLELNRVLG